MPPLTLRGWDCSTFSRRRLPWIWAGNAIIYFQDKAVVDELDRGKAE